MNVIIYIEALMICAGIILLCAAFVFLGLSGRVKTFLSDTWGIILWITLMNKFINKDKKERDGGW